MCSTGGGTEKNVNILAEIIRGREHFVELILRVEIILRLILKRKILACELNYHSGQRRVEACCIPTVKIYVSPPSTPPPQKKIWLLLSFK